MKKITLFILMITSLLGFAQTKYSKAKIIYNSPENFKKLANAGIPMDHGNHKRGVFIISDFSKTEIEIAQNLGFEVEILIEDAEADFLKRNALVKTQSNIVNPICTTSSGTINYPTPSNFSLGSMGGFFTYQEILDHLDAMHAQYPRLISSRANIGSFVTNGTPDNSVTPNIGGNPLQWVKISDNPDSDENEPEVLYDAIHHAREPASVSQLIYYMWYLLENYDSDPAIKQIVDNTELYFVPVVNPDGYLYNQKTNPNGGGLWRKNRFNTHGVDLNRNYDYHINGNPSNGVWGGQGTSGSTNSDVYHGATPFSEVETQAMKWFVEQHNFVFALNNHTHGNLLLYPYGYTNNTPTPENSLYETISEEMVAQNGFNNIISSGLYPAAGDSDDFMYGTVGTHDKIYAFTPEIGNGFWPTSNQIDGICKSMMYLNLMVAKMSHNYATVQSTGTTFIGTNHSFDASYQLKRLGVSGNGIFTVSIIPVSNNITRVEGSKNYIINSIGPIIEDAITINLNNTINIGDDIVYNIVINGGLFTETVQVTQKYGETQTIIDNNANNLNAFTHQNWGTTTSTFVSSNASITDSPNGNYGPNQNKTIVLDEEIDLTTAAVANVQFYAKWDIEASWDYVQFEVSTDNGVTWIAQCGKYTKPGSSNQVSGEPLYDGVQNDWVLEQIDLSDYLDQTIKIRFQFVSDRGQEQDGFYFDDLKVNILDNSVLSVNDEILSQIRVFPNPVKNTLKIASSYTSDYNFKIHNIFGQEVLSQNDLNGYQELNVNNLASGLYFISITLEDTTKTIKFIKQ
ncbi:M14 family zinc carboxypeptidase [Aquimarina rhabdastrellae]